MSGPPDRIQAYLGAHLSRPHLILHIDDLLFLSERQGPRHAEQQSARAQHEERLPAEAERGRDVAGGGGHDGGDGGAGCRRDDVAQGEQALGERLVESGQGFVVGANLGVWGEREGVRKGAESIGWGSECLPVSV